MCSRPAGESPGRRRFVIQSVRESLLMLIFNVCGAMRARVGVGRATRPWGNALQQCVRRQARTHPTPQANASRCAAMLTGSAVLPLKAATGAQAREQCGVTGGGLARTSMDGGRALHSQQDVRARAALEVQKAASRGKPGKCGPPGVGKGGSFENFQPLPLPGGPHLPGVCRERRFRVLLAP